MAVSANVTPNSGVPGAETVGVGLPPGITIASNETISGSGSTLGTYTVTVTATDTEGVSGTATFVWSGAPS
jgi:beta-glucosidase